jgi:hypothetical protein
MKARTCGEVPETRIILDVIVRPDDAGDESRKL